MTAAAQFRRNRTEAKVSTTAGGAEVCRLVHGEQLALTEYTVPAGFDTGGGAQDHEKIGYVVRGTVEITTDTGAHVVAAGGGYAIPAGVDHRFRVVEDALIIQTTGPPAGQ
jgi:quercetin dioxygenase-like cupin family protein